MLKMTWLLEDLYLLFETSLFSSWSCCSSENLTWPVGVRMNSKTSENLDHIRLVDIRRHSHEMKCIIIWFIATCMKEKWKTHLSLSVAIYMIYTHICTTHFTNFKIFHNNSTKELWTDSSNLLIHSFIHNFPHTNNLLITEVNNLQ